MWGARTGARVCLVSMDAVVGHPERLCCGDLLMKALQQRGKPTADKTQVPSVLRAAELGQCTSGSKTGHRRGLTTAGYPSLAGGLSTHQPPYVRVQLCTSDTQVRQAARPGRHADGGQHTPSSLRNSRPCTVKAASSSIRHSKHSQAVGSQQNVHATTRRRQRLQQEADHSAAVASPPCQPSQQPQQTDKKRQAQP